MPSQILKYKVEIEGFQDENFRIEHFDLVAGEIIFISGNNNPLKKLLYKIISLQYSGKAQKIILLDIDITDLEKLNKVDVRKQIGYMETLMVPNVNENMIKNHFHLIFENENDNYNSNLEIFDNNFGHLANDIDSETFMNLKMCLITNPKLLIFNHSFDSLNQNHMQLIMDACVNHVNATGTSIMYMTNNDQLIQNNKLRHYTTQSDLLVPVILT